MLVLVVAGLYAGSRGGGRWAGVTASLVLVACAILCVLFALVLAGMTCDEGCDKTLDEGPPPWTEDPHAWQWWGQFALTAAAFGPAVLALRAVRSGHGSAGLRWGSVSAAVLAAWGWWLSIAF